MSRVIHVVVLGALVAAATALGGWWTVPLVAAIWVRVLPHAPVRTSMLGAALGWGGLLAWTSWHASVGLLAHRLAGVFHLPFWGPAALTLLFPALLAGAAARMVQPSPFR
jgi:hypothetical protein